MSNNRPVTEDGTYDPPTGWICYYIAGRGGSLDRPNYIEYRIKTEDDYDDLRDYILYNLETWAVHSEYRMEIFNNVMPPMEVLEKAEKDSLALAKHYTHKAERIKKMIHEKMLTGC